MIQSLKCRIGFHRFVLNDKFLIWWRGQKGINARVLDHHQGRCTSIAVVRDDHVEQ